MKVLLRFVLALLICSSHGSYIGDQFNQQNKEILPQPERAMAMEKLQYLPDILQGTYFVFKKVGKFASLMRKYNAIPRISKCLKFIMPRFKTGRKIMKYYSMVKAENEGRTVIPTPPKPNPILTLAATLLNLTNKRPLFTIRSPLYPPLRSMASLAPMRNQQLKKTFPRYFGVTRRDLTKKYQYLSKRRRRYQQRKFKPIPVMTYSTPSIGELLLAHWEQLATPYDTPPTTKLVTKGLLDLLPDPNQVPYYANLALDVFDTHFDTVNSKVKTIYNAIKNKFLDMGSSSESDSSYYYDSYANETDSNSTSSESGSSSCSSDEGSNSNITSSGSAGNSTEDDQYYSESGSGSGSEGESRSYDNEDSVDSTVGTDKKNKNLNVSSTIR